jgi:hypothetical protein
MKKLILLTLTAILCMQQGYTQFTQPVKDSVLKMLDYHGAQYSITLAFKPEDYIKDNDEANLQKLTRQQLENRKKGNYTDASIYQALFVKSWFEENNQQEATRFLTEAADKYQEWINAEPDNTTPVNELLSMCISSKNYQMAPQVLKYALPLFPTHLPLLQKAIFYEQFVARAYDKCQLLINQALAVDSFDLLTLTYQSGLTSIYQMEALKQKKAFPFSEIPGLQQAAMARHKGNTGLQHLYHHHQLFYVYINGVYRSLDAQTDDNKVFEYFDLTAAEKQQVEAAESWMKEQVVKEEKNKAQLLNSLAVIDCIKRDYAAAAAHFSDAYQLNKGGNELEGKILCHMFMKSYAEAEKLIQDKIAVSGDLLDYGSLLKMYSYFSKNEKAERALLKELAKKVTDNPVKHQLLATGYLRTGQNHLLPATLSLLNETSKDDIMVKLVAAIVNGERGKTAVYLNKLLDLQADDAALLKIKKLTGL